MRARVRWLSCPSYPLLCAHAGWAHSLGGLAWSIAQQPVPLLLARVCFSSRPSCVPGGGQLQASSWGAESLVAVGQQGLLLLPFAISLPPGRVVMMMRIQRPQFGPSSCIACSSLAVLRVLLHLRPLQQRAMLDDPRPRETLISHTAPPLLLLVLVFPHTSPVRPVPVAPLAADRQKGLLPPF